MNEESEQRAWAGFEDENIVKYFRATEKNE